MNSIAENFDDSKHIITKGIISFVDKYIGCSLLRKCGITKIVDEMSAGHEMVYHDNPILRLIGQPEASLVLKKVVKARDLLIDKTLLCFYQPSAYQMFKTGTFFRNYKKDTFYRFDRMPTANWERLQLETARNVILDVESRTSRDHVNALVFDDSLYTRRRGKATEMCAKVFDHCDHKMRLGYRMMTGGWTNGEMFVPFAQVLLSTRDSKQMVDPETKVDMRTLRGKRRAASKEKGTAIVQMKVDAARNAGIPFD